MNYAIRCWQGLIFLAAAVAACSQTVPVGGLDGGGADVACTTAPIDPTMCPDDRPVAPGEACAHAGATCTGTEGRACTCTDGRYQCAPRCEGRDGGTVCPPDILAAEGTPCSEWGQTCGAERCTDRCEFCNAIQCMGGRWVRREAFPDPNCGDVGDAGDAGDAGDPCGLPNGASCPRGETCVVSRCADGSESACYCGHDGAVRCTGVCPPEDRACGSETCTADQTCVRSVGYGGACMILEDGGSCPPSTISTTCPTGQPGCVSRTESFRCESTPASCGGTPTCTCAASLCGAGCVCGEASGSRLTCQCFAP